MKKKLKRRNIIFLIIISIIVLFGCLSMVLEESSFSIIENRKLELFPHFTIKSFLSSDYQQKFDNAMADQFIFNQGIKKKINSIILLADYRKINKNICEDRYVNINDAIATYNCDNRLVYLPRKYTKERDNYYKNLINEITNDIRPTPVYYYFINDSTNYDFTSNQEIYHFDKYFNDSTWSKFTFKNYNEYKNNFYKTDHHWNYDGSYKGYKEIIKMMFSDEKVIVPRKLVAFHIKYNGSLARISKIYYFREDFKGYKFDYERHAEYVNSEKTNYGNNNYFNNKVQKDEFINHYGELYGNDYAEIIYDYHNNKDNLLIIANSFSNSINGLIASHFNKTYIIDPRHYQVLDSKFDYQKYITEHNIDRVLILGNISLFDEEIINKFGG